MARDPIHPGKFLADELAALNMAPTELAHALHVPPNRIYQILSGKRAMTADTALHLSQWFGTSADLGMNLQKQYELWLAEQQAGAEIKRRLRVGIPPYRSQQRACYGEEASSVCDANKVDAFLDARSTTRVYAVIGHVTLRCVAPPQRAALVAEV